MACQIAKLNGATVIGSVGGPQKCAFLREIGVDNAIDYKAESNLAASLMRAAPHGIDVYFDNVGGDHLEAALACSKTFARFALCGMISRYNAEHVPAPANIDMAVWRSLRLEGFIVSNYFHMMPAFVRGMAGWIAAGRVRWQQTVEIGIEQAFTAFIKLFTGANNGKMLVKLT